LREEKEKSNKTQASSSLRDQEGTILIHLPWKGRRFGGEEERRRRGFV
jgi:hypothetical protein